MGGWFKRRTGTRHSHSRSAPGNPRAKPRDPLAAVSMNRLPAGADLSGGSPGAMAYMPTSATYSFARIEQREDADHQP